MGGQRLDTALVARGLARSRTHAARLIADERVRVAGTTARKPATPVDDAMELVVDAGEDWASRGAYKLVGALDAFGVDVTGRRALDAGAAHGGFTDVLLRRGASAVAAVDVGTGQLTPRLAADPRVHVHDHTNIRELGTEQSRRIVADLGGPAQVVVADLSFISLTLVLPQLLALATAGAGTESAAEPAADVLPMVKPQFEVGKGRLGAHGVVHDPASRERAVAAVARVAADAGWGLAGVTPSPLPGPSGNVEYFLHLRTDAPIDDVRAGDLIRAAVEGGPQ